MGHGPTSLLAGAEENTVMTINQLLRELFAAYAEGASGA